jgi:hypothetical protein
LAYYAFRASVRAGLLLAAAWLMFIPANANEVTALSASEGTAYPTGLRTMRVARVITKAAPPQTYTIIAAAMGPDISPWMVEIAMNQMALGNVLPESASRSSPDTNDSSRDIDGPRFIQVD